MHRYLTEQDGAYGLLVESVDILSKCRVKFAVLGGWIPVLFNESQLHHPGTFDVDLLLDTDTTKIAFDEAIQKFLNIGYIRPVKNEFQLHRTLNVAGELRNYHVDFLHRKYAPAAYDMILKWGRMSSIAGPGTDIIFTRREIVKHRIKAYMPNGHPKSRIIPFASTLGFISAKARTLENPKRQRDLYDIFIMLNQPNMTRKMTLRAATLIIQNETVFVMSINALKEACENETIMRLAAKCLIRFNELPISEEDGIQRIKSRILEWISEIGDIIEAYSAHF